MIFNCFSDRHRNALMATEYYRRLFANAREMKGNISSLLFSINQLVEKFIIITMVFIECYGKMVARNEHN